MDDFFERVAALRREGQSFAVATVVARRPPVSAHLGDRAIVFADGRMDGFVGGACSREIVRRQALECLAARNGRLVSIRPDAGGAGPSGPEHVVVAMSCASEGAVDVFVEPFVRARTLVVAGVTPVAASLARLARSMGYDVVRAVDARETGDLEQEAAALDIRLVTLDAIGDVLRERRPDVAAVVASQGHYDEQALEAILPCAVAYVGLVASRKRGATVRELITSAGVAGADAVRIPAGLDLGAITPSEVALSILAEIVQADRARAGRQPAASETPAPAPAIAIDPVCNMEVEIATARHVAEVEGATYYFCCAQCRARFLTQPEPFLSRAT
jgi:xanthine dehydrogenase accessory factor